MLACCVPAEISPWCVRVPLCSVRRSNFLRKDPYSSMQRSEKRPRETPSGNQVGSASNTAKQASASLVDLPDKIWRNVFDLGTHAGDALTAGLLLETLYHSLPLTWRIQLQGGKWELFDANAMSRKNAFGKSGKLRLRPRMALRARGVRLTWLIPNARMTGGALRLPAVGAKSIADGLRISGASKIKLIPSDTYNALKWRGALGGNAVGLLITVGPQTAMDAYNAGLYQDAGDKDKWADFAIASAKSQSSNLAGFGVGLIAGVVLTSAAVAAGVTVAAPVAIIVGFAAGVAGQQGFNAFGLNDRAEEFVRGLFGR